jgi:hypothetical protein
MRFNTTVTDPVYRPGQQSQAMAVSVEEATGGIRLAAVNAYGDPSWSPQGAALLVATIGAAINFLEAAERMARDANPGR